MFVADSYSPLGSSGATWIYPHAIAWSSGQSCLSSLVSASSSWWGDRCGNSVGAAFQIRWFFGTLSTEVNAVTTQLRQ
jgi:hypothetical protein